MSSTGSPKTDSAGPAYRSGFDGRFKGCRAECEGGKSIEGTHFAGRANFTGTLTGDYRDFGDYPWRWYLLTDLTEKPASFPHLSVWCAEESLTLIDRPAADAPQGA